jgi:hypothetical protein
VAWPQPNRAPRPRPRARKVETVAEVEAGSDFKIFGRTRCRPRNAFRIEHEDEDDLVAAMPQCPV